MAARPDILVDHILEWSLIADIHQRNGNVKDAPLHRMRLIEPGDYVIEFLPLSLEFPGGGTKNPVQFVHRCETRCGAATGAARPDCLSFGWERLPGGQ